MVVTRREYRAEIRRRVGLSALLWELVVGIVVFLAVWIFGAWRDGKVDRPELEDFVVGGLVVLLMEGTRQFAGRRKATYEMHCEQAIRADSAEAQAQKFQETRAHGNWHEVSGRFLTLRDYGISVERVLYVKDGKEREAWELRGNSEAHQRSFKAVCELAGDTLTISKIWSRLPAEVKDEKDPFVRWVRYVANCEGIKETGTGDRWENDVLIHEYTTWGFDDLVMASKRLCQDNLLYDRMVNS